MRKWKRALFSPSLFYILYYEFEIVYIIYNLEFIKSRPWKVDLSFNKTSFQGKVKVTLSQLQKSFHEPLGQQPSMHQPSITS